MTGLGYSLPKQSNELASRIGDIVGNIELGPRQIIKAEEELLNDIKKSRELAKVIIERLDFLEGHVERTVANQHNRGW